jgi:transposase
VTIFSLAVIYFHLNLPPMPRALDHAALVEQIWPTIEPIMPRTPLGSDLSRARTKRFLEAILWLVDADGDWDSLPEDYGERTAIYQRFNRWSRKGTWERVFKLLNSQERFPYQYDGKRITNLHCCHENGLRLSRRIYRRHRRIRLTQ